jgi:hypothetical protein
VSADRGRDLTLLAARAALRVAPERALELLARDTDWYPRERSVARLRIEALARTGQDAERADELARYADRYPADPWLRRTRLAFELERDFPAALEGIWQRHLQGKTTPAELEETVWMALFQDPSRPDWQRVTRLADAAAASSAGTNAWQNLLLAAAFTESGDLTQARKALRSAWAPQLQLRWVVLGRMAEKLGLREVAQQAFARVMPADDPRDPYTSAVLAQRALQRLRASPAK